MSLLSARAPWRTAAAAATASSLLLLSACGGGKGGFPEAPAPMVAAAGNDVVLASFEPGAAMALIVADGTGVADTAVATAQAVASNATAGGSALKVTLQADSAMIGLASEGGGGLASDWTGFRTLMVDVTSDRAIDAGAIKLVTKAGSSFKWCPFGNTQAVPANTTTTLSFRLDWAANGCGATAADVAAIKFAYVALAGGAGNVLHLDNLRLTKAVRVMALGDSITGNPGCWRQVLWADTLAGRTSPPVDMVGVRSNASECASGGAGWDADNAGFGGMVLRTTGGKLGLADAGRGDTVGVAAGVTAVPGNLPVWLERARPDVLLVNLGTNDVWNAAATAAIVSGLDTLVDQARASHPGMRVVVAQIPRFAPSGCADCPTRAAAFNAAVAAWAECKRSARSPVTVADLDAGWNAATMTGDGVHPNAAGNVAMAANWKRAVTAALDTLDTEGSGPASSCTPAAAGDVADGTTAGDTFTITSFKAGVAAMAPTNNDGNPSAPTQATLALDSTGTRATEGSQAAAFTVIAAPAGGWVSAAQTGNGGLADWTGYRTLKFDVKTGASAFSGAIYLQSGADWSKWCQSADVAIDANGTGTVTMDLTGCAAIDLTRVQRFGLVSWTTGTFYVDNVRLGGKAGSGNPASGSDLADGSTSATQYTITSFGTGVDKVMLLNNDGNPSAPAQATLAQDTSGTRATDGGNAAVFTVVNPPAGGSVAIGNTNNGGLPDWRGYRTLSFDVTTGATAFTGVVVLQSGSGWNWCQGNPVDVAANSTGTVSLDLASCTGADLSLPQRFQMFSWVTGTFYVDNIRLGR